LFEKLPVFWQSAGMRPAFPRTIQQLIGLRKAHAALRDGEMHWLHNSDEDHVLTFARRDDAETLVVAINLSAHPFVGVIDAGTGHYIDAMADTAAGLPAITLGAWEFRVFRKQQ
jgi:glycosidase